MNVPVIPTVVLTGLVTVAGLTSDKARIEGRFWAGIAVYAIAMSYLDNYSPEFAGMFALLVLIGAVWKFAPSISKSLKGVK